MSVAAFPQEAMNWLGRLPAGWQVKPLKHVVRVNPEALSDSTDPDWRMTYADISSVSLGQGIVDAEELAFEDAPSRARRLVSQGDTLVSTVRTYLRAITVVREPPENLVASTGFAVLRPSSAIDANFLGYFATSDVFVNAVVAQSVGVSYPATNASDIVRLPIAFPHIDEQQEIAAFLDRKTAEIDTLIAKKRRLLDRLAEKRTALITRAVTKGLNPDAPMKDSGIEWLGEIPVHWEIAQLRRALLEVEQGWSPTCEDRLVTEGEWGVLKSGCVNGGEYDESNHKALPPGLEPRASLLVKPNDVLMCRASGSTRLIGSVAIVSETTHKLMFSDKTYRLSVDEGIMCSKFLVHSMGSKYMREQILLSISGAEGLANNIPQSAMKDYQICVPPIGEQKEIAKNIEQQKAQSGQIESRIEQAIDLLKEYRSALITNAVTGQIKVA